MVLREERGEGDNDVDPFAPRYACPHYVSRKHALFHRLHTGHKGVGGGWVGAAVLADLAWQVR